MKGKKRKGQRKTLQTNENTKISMQEVDEEKWICMQAEAYYRAMKRIEAERDEKPLEAPPNKKILYQLIYILNFFFWPFKISKKIKLKEGVYNLPIIFAISVIMRIVGFIAWASGLTGMVCSIFKGNFLSNIVIISMYFLLFFIGSMLLVAVQEFEKEEDSNKIYAFAGSFLALASLCVSIVALLNGKI